MGESRAVGAAVGQRFFTVTPFGMLNHVHAFTSQKQIQLLKKVTHIYPHIGIESFSTRNC